MAVCFNTDMLYCVGKPESGRGCGRAVGCEREGAGPARSRLPIQRGLRDARVSRCSRLSRLPGSHPSNQWLSMCTGNKAYIGGAAGPSFDVLDAGRCVHVELAAALAQQKLNGGKVFLVNLGVLFKFGPVAGVAVSIAATSSHLQQRITSQRPGSACGWLRAFCGIRGGSSGRGTAPLSVYPTGALRP